MESSENRARAGSAYRGKAAIFRIMESTMAYRGFLRPGRSALVNAPATVVELIVGLPRWSPGSPACFEVGASQPALSEVEWVRAVRCIAT